MNRLNINNKRGFTLMELLIATLLMAIVLTGAYSMFNNVIRHWRMGSENASTYHDARLIFSLLERDLAGIPSDESTLDARAFFLGETDTLEFLTVIEPMPSDEPSYPRLMQVRYRLDKRRLIREEAALESELPAELSDTGRFDRDLIEFSDANEQVITSGILTWKLSYIWTPQTEEALNALLESDVATYQLPDAVAISINLFDPSTPDSSATEFSKTIRFWGPSSPVPENLQANLTVEL